MPATFVFTCGCKTEAPIFQKKNSKSKKSRLCPNHPQRSLKEVITNCSVCGEEIVYKAGQYKAITLHLCREHKLIRERFNCFNSNCKRLGKELPVWETYLETFNEKYAGRKKFGPRH